MPSSAAALLASAVFAALAQASNNGDVPQDRGRPNVLFLYVDDQAFDTVRALGNAEIQTPNLDRLVEQGTTFTHAYNMGAWGGAVCVASRTMLVTGRSLHRARRDHKSVDEKYREQNLLWPQLMAGGGYATYLSGKWHVNAKADLAFEVSRNIRPGMPNQTPEGYDRPRLDVPDPWRPDDTSKNGYWKGGKHWSEVLADDAVEYLQLTREDERPFFLYLAFNAPHDPRQAPREYVDRYPPDSLALPPPFLEEYPFAEAMGAGKKLRDERLGPFPRTEHAVRVHRQEYYAIISHLDDQVGRILRALEQSGQAENTWIFYTADHGLACGHHGLLGKQNMYDPSMRVPFMVRGPGVEAGRRISAPIYLQDVMPTALELAGVEVPGHVDFHSLLPHLRGDADAVVRDTIYGSYTNHQRMVQAGGHKLILYPKAKVHRLFDLRDDPFEQRDLAGDAAHADTCRKLFARLQRVQRELEDPLDLSEVYPELR